MKIVIVGGVAGGATAAARLRRLSEKYEIIIFERDSYVSYANCGLPYYIGDTITDKQKLQVQTVAGLKNRFNIDTRIRSEVLSVDRDKKSVAVKNLESGEVYNESYDRLILSCGAKPIAPKIKGIENAHNVFTLRNIPDTYKIKDFINNAKPAKAVVIGGGFIGVEMAENLAQLGIDVTIVEKMPQVLKQLDFEMAQIVHQELNANGVNIILNDGVMEFFDGGKNIKLESGKLLESDITILAIGVMPDNTLAKQAGLKLGARGHIITTKEYNALDEVSGKTIDDIFAIGDMIEVTNAIDGSAYAVPLAWGANRQGRLVADYISGMPVKEQKILGSSVLKVFNLVAASTGANEETLKNKGIEYDAIHAHRSNHASYYPNSSNIALKMLFDKKTGKIFGAQAVGGEGTEKRIDVLATAIRLGGTVFDLSDLELAYAPPYSSAKDPVNILGYIAENVVNNVYKTIYPNEIDGVIKNGGLVIDVRSDFENSNGHIEGSKNIDLDTLRQNIDKLPADKNAPVYLYCQVGLRGYLASNILRDNGYTDLYNLSGGYATYKAYKYKTGVKAKIKATEVNDMQHSSIGIKEIDVTGIQCPGPLMATYKALESMNSGEKLKVTATDCGFTNDIENWCKTNGHTLDGIISDKGKFVANITKGAKASNSCAVTADQKNATIVVFSGALDKVLASMIIAQGAAAQGKDVTMFFTFWGLNALRRDNAVRVKKNLIERMFGKMMPRGANKLPLSNMNMGGMGARMIKGIMRKKNVDSLPEMIKKAQEVGVKMLACTMSMDLMGIKKEELIDGIEYAGVATYIAKNENVGTTLFI